MPYNNYNTARSNERNDWKPKNNADGKTICPQFFLYKEGTKTVDRNLYDKTAQDIAKSLSGISKTRLRRFFDEVKKLSNNPCLDTNFEKEEASIMLLKSKISYMIGRTNNRKEKNALNNLKAFFDIGLKQVHDAAAYHVFVTLFEAVYGFFYEEAYD